ncbi:helix-turn-helix domain-containing protein [Actinomadura gamaensis]|uniref:Helix-turn-helix domain-containing protein n=1 Tax=Actinomadura gamaensis TaxID=1763541 RepID=A0ABV9UAS1_9ACTN
MKLMTSRTLPTKGKSALVTGVPGEAVQLSEKIDSLFRTVYPAGGKPYSLQEAAEGIEALTGEKVSHNTLWKLRTGKAENPTKRVLEAIAKFFGVNPTYFFDDESAEQITKQIELLALLRESGIQGAQLRSYCELSKEGRDMVGEMILRTARIERMGREGKAE